MRTSAQVNPGQDPSTIVPRYAAALLTEKSSPDSLITVSNGRAVAATVREVAIQDWPKSNVAQMVGALSPSNPMTDRPTSAACSPNASAAPSPHSTYR